MIEALQTQRLSLRPWVGSDRALLLRLASDARVVRYIGDGTVWSAERVAEVAEAAAEHWRRHEFGWRVIVPTDTGEEVGLVMLNHLGEGTAGLDPREFEVGWWLAPSVWRRGFATEAGRAVCREAFERVRAPSLIARLQPENHASAGVAKRLGMRHELDTTGRFGEPVAVYRLLAAERAAAGPRA
jgi:RimJ/RimL family protein N-acetyltransferase